jgi:hypothetical protein
VLAEYILGFSSCSENRACLRLVPLPILTVSVGSGGYGAVGIVRRGGCAAAAVK